MAVPASDVAILSKNANICKLYTFIILYPFLEKAVFNPFRIL